MSKKLIWISAFALALILGQTSFACSGHKDCNAHQKLDKLATELDLTAEQKEKLETFKEQAKASTKANHEQLKALRGQISALVKSDKIDETKLDSLILQVNKIRGSMLKNRIMMQHEMYSILTEKQKMKFIQLKEKWDEKHH